MKTTSLRLFRLPAFWLAVVIPTLLACISTLWLLRQQPVFFDPSWLGIANAVELFKIPLLLLLLMLPTVALVLTTIRLRNAIDQTQLQREHYCFSHGFIHVREFTDHMGTDLLKRLGISPRVLHRAFYPRASQGDFAFNLELINNIHGQFVAVLQAAKVVNQWFTSLDGDEKAVAQNRLEFVIEQSVQLLYFLAKQFKGHPPQCREYYFLKDAMADHWDLINAVTYFDGIAEGDYDLSAFNQLFEIPEIKAWFNRNDHILRGYCEGRL